MDKVLIVFASMSGNTEEIAEIIESKLLDLQINVTKLQIDYDDIPPSDLLQYNAILFGTYTWGDGDIPYETEEFFDDLEDIHLDNRVVGLFGSCDSMYLHYGGAIDEFAKQFQKQGAYLVSESLKIELSPMKDDITKCEQFVQQFLNELSKVTN